MRKAAYCFGLTQQGAKRRGMAGRDRSFFSVLEEIKKGTKGSKEETTTRLGRGWGLGSTERKSKLFCSEQEKYKGITAI